MVDLPLVPPEYASRWSSAASCGAAGAPWLAAGELIRGLHSLPAQDPNNRQRDARVPRTPRTCLDRDLNSELSGRRLESTNSRQETPKCPPRPEVGGKFAFSSSGRLPRIEMPASGRVE